MRPSYKSYQRIDISTAEPLRITVLLYEGAIKNLNQCVRLFPTDPQTASVRLNKTLDIIHYLRNTLDFENGGHLAGNLERLYDYMRDTLAAANISKATAKIQEVIGLLQTLLEGWRGLDANTTHSGAGDAAAGEAKTVSLVG